MEKKFKEIIGIEFNKFYKDVRPALINVLKAHCGYHDKIDVEGIADDAFVKLLEKIDLYNPQKGIITTYLFNIGIYMILHEFRKVSRQKQTSINSIYEDDEYDILDENMIYDKSIDKKIDIVIDEMDSFKIENLKKIVLLKSYGFKNQEIADALDISIECVKNKMHKIRILNKYKLKNKLKYFF